MAQKRNTVALQEYLDLQFEDLVDPDFSEEEAFYRAIKVFVLSFQGYDVLFPELYEQMFEEYLHSMQDLYDYGIDDENIDYIQIAKNELKDPVMNAVFGIKRVKGLRRADGTPMVRNLKVVVEFDDYANPVIDVGFLNVKSEEQTYVTPIALSFDQLAYCRINNRAISCRLVSDDWAFNLHLNVFSINFREISYEGFEDWFDFGRGVQILIKIEIQVADQTQYEEEYGANFHLKTILLMLQDRFEILNLDFRPIVDKVHSYSAHKSKISYIRKRVDPNSEMAFWLTGSRDQQIMRRIETEILETESNYSEIPQILSKRVQYCDLQISHYFTHDYEETVCLCSEWCNFNAFFHFHPIFRFLLVNHNQLYLRDKTKIADIYLFCSTAILYMAEHMDRTQNPGGQPDKAPVFQLLNQANEYRKTNYMRYFMKKRDWNHLYRTAVPDFATLNGMSHKLLSATDIIPFTVIQSSPDPFADICCENLTIYYNVFSDLHLFVSMIGIFVESKAEQNRKWFKELERMSREDFGIYLMTGFEIRVDEYRAGYDFLFTEDYDYSNVFIKDENHRFVKNTRDMVYRYGDPQNPLQIRLILNPLIACFASVYKVLHKVEPMLPKVNVMKAFKDVFELCCELDEAFVEHMNHTEPQIGPKIEPQIFGYKSFLFFIESELPQQTPEIIKRFYVFYTLRSYWMAFGIQKYFISSCIQRNRKSEEFTTQVVQQFKFIFDFDHFQTTFFCHYNQSLFNFPNYLEDEIKEFYNYFWKMAKHEANSTHSTYHDCIDSGLFEYKRLYFWWKNDGDNRRKFQRILEVLAENQDFLLNRSNEIYDTYIVRGILDIEDYEYSNEVFDDLVYYLVRAVCFMIVISISQLMDPLHKLQVEHLFKNHCSFTLSKPGLVLLIKKSMKQTFERLNQIQVKFIDFEDQNDRIVNTISQTRKLIKNIFRQFYNKLCIEWIKEMYRMYAEVVDYQNKTTLLHLHLASGLSFVMAFIDDFRKYSHKFRKNCGILLGPTMKPNPFVAHQVTFGTYIPQFEQYLQDRTAMDRAKPFLENIWHTVLGPVFQEFDQMTAQELKINLNEANI